MKLLTKVSVVAGLVMAAVSTVSKADEVSDLNAAIQQWNSGTVSNQQAAINSLTTLYMNGQSADIDFAKLQDFLSNTGDTIKSVQPSIANTFVISKATTSIPFTALTPAVKPIIGGVQSAHVNTLMERKNIWGGIDTTWKSIQHPQVTIPVTVPPKPVVTTPAAPVTTVPVNTVSVNAPVQPVNVSVSAAPLSNPVVNQTAPKAPAVTPAVNTVATAPVVAPVNVVQPKAPSAPVTTPAASTPVVVPPVPVVAAPKTPAPAPATTTPVVVPTKVVTPVAPKPKQQPTAKAAPVVVPVAAQVVAPPVPAPATPKANKRTGYKAGAATTPAAPAINTAPSTPASNPAPVVASAAVIPPLTNTPVVQQQTLPPSQAKQNAAQIAQMQQQYQQTQARQAQIDQMTQDSINALIDAHNENVGVLDNHEGRISSLESHEKQQDKRIAENNKKAMAGIAGALAQTGLHYTDSANSVAAGVGTYDGQNAVAVGYSHQWGNSVRFSVQNSADTAHNFGASASVAIGW